VNIEITCPNCDVYNDYDKEKCWKCGRQITEHERQVALKQADENPDLSEREKESRKDDVSPQRHADHFSHFRARPQAPPGCEAGGRNDDQGPPQKIEKQGVKNIQRCPHCNHQQPENATQCSNCGIIFDKYQPHTRNKTSLHFFLGGSILLLMFGFLFLKTEQNIIFVADQISYPKNSNSYSCQEKCSSYSKDTLDTLLESGWELVSSAPKTTLAENFRTQVYSFSKRVDKYGCECIGQEYILKRRLIDKIFH
jgi:predicted nucleic acid-binding Zn ribbon protein